MKRLKIVAWIFFAFVLISIIVSKLFQYYIKTAFGENCETKSTWKIEGYEIVEQQCIGFAGPHYYPLHLYKNNNEISYVTYKNDSCNVKFTEKNGDTLYFNLCANTLIRKAK